MRDRRLLIIVSTLALTVAWAWLLARDIAGVRWAAHFSPWSVAVLLIVAAAGSLVTRRPLRARAGLWSAIFLSGLAFILLHAWPASELSMHRAWWRDSSQRIATAIGAVGDEVAGLEQVSTGIAARTRALVAARGVDELQSDPTEAFALLDSIARGVARGETLPPGTAIGLQLFAANGERLAWAGWPQATGAVERVFLAGSEEFFYTRNVSLYQILSHVVPCRSAAGETVASLLVDMPFEVDYRVNNRFLKSASLADNIPKITTVRVTFTGFPATGNLPQRLERMREQQTVDQERRARLRTTAQSRPHTRIDAQADTLMTASFTWEDSLLTYGTFPANVEPESEVGGNELMGLSGGAVIRSVFGNPLLTVVAVGEPLEHFVSMRARTRVAWATAFLLLSLVALFAQLMVWVPVPKKMGGRPDSNLQSRLARAGIFAAFVVTLRYALLAFGTTSTRTGSRLLDPSVFATPALGGLMRSTFDLVTTAVFFLVLVYGLMRILREREDQPQPATRPAPWRVVLAGLVAWGAGFGALAMIRQLTETVVVNANPRLIGETMALNDITVLVLHVSLFLMVSGLLLAAVFVTWGLLRALGVKRILMPCIIALALTVAMTLLQGSWILLVLMLPFLWFVAYAPRIAQREDLVSVGIASFALVAIASGVTYSYLTLDYDELRKGFVLEKSKEVARPSDNWKVVILEDVLEDFAQRHEIRQAVRSSGGQSDAGRLAFDLWADSPLSLLGYSCAIHVLDAQDQTVGEFSVDMPYRARPAEGGERTDTPVGERWAVLDLTRSTTQGVVRFYRGIANIDESDVFEDTTRVVPLIGKVIVDLPFFFESLELAARTGPRTPEVLRNVQQGGVAPRVEEPEALLLARVDAESRITESSSEQLPVGEHVSDVTLDAAFAGDWPVLHSAGSSYRLTAMSYSSDPGTTLLAGFLVPSLGKHLLRWSTLLSLYMSFALLLLIAVVVLSAVPALRSMLPTLTPGGRVGFQQKLLASFLVVALVPALLLGAFSVDFIKQRFVEESRDEAVYKAQSARKAFVNLLHGELQFFLTRADLASFLTSEGPAMRPLGNGRIAVLFGNGARNGVAPETALVGTETVSTEDLVVTTINGTPYLGVFSSPIGVTPGSGSGYYMYYARAIDADMLVEIAEQVGSDVNIYADGDLVSSSREGLLAGGFISAAMSASAYVEVSLLGSDRALATERAGSYEFQVAYLPVDRWTLDTESRTWKTAPTRAAIAVPLLFRPESYSMEVQRATSVLLGGFALLLVATIGLGLVVARGVFEPLRELVAGTRRISRGDYDVRLREDRADEVGMVASAFNEMTQRIAASQRALEERRRYLETILENIGTGVISTDADGRVRTVNSAAERITAMQADELIGHDAAELISSSRASKIFALLADGPKASFASGEVELGVGERRATIKYMRTHLEADDRPFGTVLVFEDVTELIESKKLSAWVEMARQIAHEIKNPLTPIRISTQFMRRAYEQRPDDFERIFREGTDTIIQQVDVLKRIAGEFSSYGRMQRLELKPLPVDPLVRRIVSPYENNTSGVHVHYENGAGDASVMADAEAVRKICANLIENAIEAMGAGGGELQVRCTEVMERDTPMIRISFRDNGPGLGEGAANRLFEPYFSTKTTGTGLGLAICRTLSREMGGDVTVKNVEDGNGVEAALILDRA